MYVQRALNFVRRFASQEASVRDSRLSARVWQNEIYSVR
jgi:hypothetical protein